MAAFNLDDFDVVKAHTLKEPHSITIYGPPGKGKTVFASSIVKVPGFERTIVLDTEGGAVAIGAYNPEADVLSCPTAAKFSAALEGLLSGKLVERTSGLPYQAVIIDTIDKAQSRQLDVFAKAPEAKTQNGGDNPLYKWGAVKIWMEKISDLCHQADFLTIFVVHAEDHKDDNGTVTTTVMLGGASRFNFPSVSDAVGYFNVSRVKGPSDEKPTDHRTVDFRVATRYVTKQRFADRLNGIFIDPDMTRIFDKIRGTDG